MMLSDAPRYVEEKVNKPESEKSDEDEGNEIAGYFRSKLSQ